MASKRIAKSTIDWAHFQKIIPPTQTNSLNSFMGKSYQYVSRVQSLPEHLPKIDFAAYKSALGNKALVDKFEKAYASLQVPFPVDKENLLTKIDADEKQQEKEVNEFVHQIKDQVAQLEAQRAKITNLPPLDEMTVELQQYYFPKDLNDISLLIGDGDEHQKMIDAKKNGQKAVADH